MKRKIASLAPLIAVAGLYVISARLGLMMGAVAGFATLVWAPSGIALAALLTFGYRVWPGVLVGALVVNVWTGAPLLVALGIAVGNTLEAVAGTYALRRIPGFQNSLDRVRDAVGLILLAAALSTMISATVGVSSLYLGHIVRPAEIADVWRVWWVGDVMGDLVVAPVLLVWVTGAWLRLEPPRLLEAAALALSVVTATALIFGGRFASNTSTFGHAYLLFPPLIWAALRFGQRGAVSAVFLSAIIAVWATAMAHGPFVRPVLYESLFALQIFMGVAAATFLILGSSVSQQRRGEEQLRRAQATAAQANRAKSEFLAVMSHELRTPLNAIAGYVELMSMGLEGPLTEKQGASLVRIQRNQEHLLSLIDDVLSFAKIETGRLSLSMQPVLVRDALNGLESLIQPELRRKELTFRCGAVDDSLSARADPEKLRQILVNLLANAVKFTAPGGLITLGAERDQETLRIWVSDTGIGIPADQLARVFDPFFQVERGPTRRYSGVGLGLSIARDLARAMRGDLRLESRVGEGSTASLVLPSV